MWAQLERNRKLKIIIIALYNSSRAVMCLLSAQPFRISIRGPTEIIIIKFAVSSVQMNDAYRLAGCLIANLLARLLAYLLACWLAGY